MPLPLWFVDLEPKDNNKAIYDLRYLQQTKVLVEAPKPRRELIQCKRCQRFGHTRTYCTLPYSCVKCGGAHDNRDCPKNREAKPSCALCGEEHTANYKGCGKYKERLKAVSSKYSSRNRPPAEHQQWNGNKQVQAGTFKDQGKSYADAVINNQHDQRSSTNQNVTTIASNIELMLEKSIHQNAQLMTLLTSLMEKVLALIEKLK